MTIDGERAVNYRYDELGRLVELREALGLSEYYGYDGYGNKTSKVDRAGNATVYRYDIEGRAIEEIDPLGQTNRVTYDGAGNILSMTDKRGFHDVEDV